MVQLVVENHKRTIVGKFIHTTWTCLNVRCINGLYRVPTIRNKAYNNVSILFSRIDFKDWCYKHRLDIENCIRPSIDRIDSSKDYSLDNIQILELSLNCAKANTVFTESTGRCYKCKETKTIEEFVKSNRTSIGRTSICKRCDTLRRRVPDDKRQRKLKNNVKYH